MSKKQESVKQTQAEGQIQVKMLRSWNARYLNGMAGDIRTLTDRSLCDNLVLEGIVEEISSDIGESDDAT